MLDVHETIREGILGIGFSGQMHGLVMTDRSGNPIRNAIIWADQRSAGQIEDIYGQVSREKVSRVFCNRLSTGFMLPSLLWVREHEPQKYERIHKIMCPKDYIRYRICGEWGTDASDGSGTGMWDMKNRTWACEMLRELNIPGEILVENHEAYEKAGEVTRECAELTGLREGTFVAYGGEIP